MPQLLTVQNLTKIFEVSKSKGLFKKEKEKILALDDFNLVIEKPMILGLIGANGAGKTTFIKHCLGLIQKSSGFIKVLGFDPYKHKAEFLKSVGFVSGQKQNMDLNLSGLENLRLSGYLYDMNTTEINSQIEYLSRLFKVEEKLEVPIRQLSLGQRMKFEIISSVLHGPKFLFMDEPSLGLDFESQSVMREMLMKLHKEQQLTILLTSHYMPDITTLCERVVVIENGRKVFEGSLTNLIMVTDTDGYLKTLVLELNKKENF